MAKQLVEPGTAAANSKTRPTRRQMLAGMAIAGATASTPFIGASIAKSATADTLAWDAALPRWKAVEQTYDAICDRHDAVEEAYGDASPRIDRYFDDYGLNTSMERGHVEGALTIYNTRMRLNGAAKVDVAKVADEFDAYQKRDADLRKHYRVDEYWDAVTAYRPTFFRARDRIMEVPAPHVAALLVKIEIASISLDNNHADAMLADARRLLGRV